MPTTLQDHVAQDSFTLNATTEHAGIVVPSEASWMYVSSDKILAVRLGASGQAVGLVARVTDGAHPWKWDVSSLRSKTIYLYNTEATSASVYTCFQNRKV